MRAAARGGDIDRYLAALLVPGGVRDDLIALAAFAGEIERVPRTVAEPMIGEIRLQWWWDVLAEAANPHLEPARTGHPVADALSGLVRAGRVEAGELQAAIDARRHDLYADAMPDAAALALHLDAGQGTLFRQAARIAIGATAGQPLSEVADRASREAGAAYALARILCDLPLARARGRNPFPGASLAGSAEPSVGDGPSPGVCAHYCAAARAHLARARVALREAPGAERAALRAALLPAALVEPYLRAFEGTSAGGGANAEACDILPLTRAWTLLKARHIRKL